MEGQAGPIVERPRPGSPQMNGGGTMTVATTRSARCCRCSSPSKTDDKRDG